jgi:hypothetical protein
VPILAFETGLYSALTAGTALIAGLGGTFIYNKVAPQGAAPPYVIFQQQGGGDINDTPIRSRNPLYAIFGVGATAEAAAAIDRNIDALLHDQSLTVSGWSNYSLAREIDVQFIDLDAAGNKIYRCGGMYRALIDYSG